MSNARKDPRDTPAMRQFRAFKQQHPDCILFFRMGDFYEMFDDDALAVSKALGLTLTQRTQGIPMAGIPHHQLDVYLRRAVDAGFRVAVVDQVQDPKDARGIVERRVTRVITPGTLVDEPLVRDETATRIACCCTHAENAVAGAACDLSTGEVILFTTHPDTLADTLTRLSVVEVLCAEGTEEAGPIADACAELDIAVTPRPPWQLRRDEALQAVCDLYKVASLAGFGLDPNDPEIPPLGALVRALTETQTGDPNDPYANDAALDHLRPPVRDRTDTTCFVDRISLRALEIERTIRDQQIDGSLLALFVRGPAACRTPMGKRLIRDWLCSPLADRSQIESRHARVELLTFDETLAEHLHQALEPVQDVARLAGRLALARLSPRDLVALARSIAQLPALAETIADAPPFAEAHAQLDDLRADLEPLARHICEACVESPPPHLREGGLIADGVDPELDEARSLQRDASSWLARYQARLIDEHELPSLKVGYNKVFGYYIELPAAQARRAPPAFTRKQTLKNAERYITPELKQFEDKVQSAQSRAIQREQQIFDDLCARARTRLHHIQAFARLAAELDALLCFARCARMRRWGRPQIVDEPVLDIHDGRHPVLDQTLAASFVSNDLRLGGREPRLALITGPNMAGKSTYIRQNALITLLAHAGSFVPAANAVIGICDRIFTRVGADDALHRGQSTFMVEMAETANILNNATERSLVILDEIGRGTSTLDGLSLAWAIAERLVATRCRTLFATHYHELTELEERLEGHARNLRVLVREFEDQIIFLHRIEPGRADQSYGVQVARLAGIPQPVVQRAREILASLRVHETGLRTSTTHNRTQDPQLTLFTEYIRHPAVDRLREIKLESLSPLEAFDILRSLKNEVQSDGDAS